MNLWIIFSSKLVFSSNREVLCKGAETQTGPDDNEDKVGTIYCLYWFMCLWYNLYCWGYVINLSRERKSIKKGNRRKQVQRIQNLILPSLILLIKYFTFHLCIHFLFVEIEILDMFLIFSLRYVIGRTMNSPWFQRALIIWMML